MTDYGYSLQYYPNGNVQTATEAFASGSDQWQYQYDDLNRLGNAVNSALGKGCTYGYDNWGNRLTEAPAGGPGSSCFSQTLSINESKSNQQLNSPDQYCFDASGNMLDDGPCPVSGAHKYAYDGEGRLASANYGAETFIYDADGRRVGTYDGSNYANVMYDNVTGEPLSEWTNLGWTERELWVSGRHLGYVINGTMTWSAGDWLGSERVRTDSSGNLVGSFESLPFGDGQTTLSGTDNDIIHFTGKERDTESGLDYFGARYYGSSLGRFISPDFQDDDTDPEPSPWADFTNPQSLNLYSYVLNNPVSHSDPDGHDCIDTSIFSNTGTIAVVSGDNCLNNLGPNAIYVNGTVDAKSLTASVSASGTTFGYNYTSPDGQSGGSGVIAQAPTFGSLEGPANQAGLNLLSTSAGVVNAATVGYAAVFGTAGAGAVVGSAGGLMTIAGDSGLDLLGNQAINRMIGASQRELLKDFFKSGQLPKGLSQQTLRLYKEVAQRAIAAGKDQLGVQAQRLQMIINAIR